MLKRNDSRSVEGADRSGNPLRSLVDRELTRRDRIIISVLACLIVVLIIGRTELEQGRPSGEAVPWADYPVETRTRIDALATAVDCPGLAAERRSAEADTAATMARTGHDNARLVSYISDLMTSIEC